MRNYTNIDRYLTILSEDVYAQPEDDGHTALSKSVIDFWMSRMTDCITVLDVGCGEAFAETQFRYWEKEYTGICLGEDYMVAKELGRNVRLMDFNFLEFPDMSFDLIFSRHSLEHSFSPLISLMEWRRVARSWIGLVLPAPEHYKPGGRNHPFVLYKEQWLALFEIAGLRPIWDNDQKGADDVTWEYWLMLEKCGRPVYA